MAKAKKPFDKILTIRSRLDMYVEYGEDALQGQSPQEFAAEVREAFNYLMDFRNIINGMVGFDEEPARAVVHYLPEDVVKEYMDA